MSVPIERGFPAYRAVLRSPGVPLLALGAAVASLPIGLLGLALMLVVRDRGDAFTAGGLVVAGLGVGAVAGMLAQGRLIDRFGFRRVLLPAAAVRLAAGAAFLVGDRLPLPVTVGLVVVVGVGEPQVSNALRAALPRLVDHELRAAAAAVSALMFELPVLVGPLLLTALLVLSTPATVVLVGIGSSAVGTCLFAASSSAARPLWNTPAARPTGPPGSVLDPLRIPAVRQLVAIIAVQGLAVGVAQVASVARVDAQGSTFGAGLLYAALTAGSLTGTTIAGSRWGRDTPAGTVPMLLLGLAVTTGTASIVPTQPLLAMCLLGFGLCAGPLVLRCFVALETTSGIDDAPTTAITLLVAAGLAATSAGAALAGWLVDAAGPSAPLVVAMAALLCAALATWASGRRRDLGRQQRRR